MNIKKYIPLILLNILALAYLAYPLPQIPNLVASLKSTEPGDTTQLQNVSAFYNNLERQAVINFYVDNYQKKHPLALKINHPPEKAKVIIKDTIQTYYLEEIIIPFKQSLFINGYNWQKDVFTAPETRIKNKMLVDGQEFTTKVTLKTYTTSSMILSYFVLFLIQATVIYALHTYKQVFSSHD